MRLANWEKSAVAEHVHNQEELHEIDWSSVRIIDCAQGRTKRKIRESVAIQCNKPLMNRDDGIEGSNTWNAILG